MPTYEMLWDCASCGTTKLLGKTHRRCPNCGAPQVPSARYFPPPGEEVPVEGHVYVGVDWACAACTTPNSRAARFCVSCGNPREGNADVARRPDEVVVRGVASPRVALRGEVPAAPRPRSKKPLVVAAVILTLLAAALVTVFWQKDVQVRVEAHSWTRDIDIQRLDAVRDSAWCDSMPHDAYSVSRSREVRSHNNIPDGQDCHTVRTDNGDGTFSTGQECKTRYRKEPVYDDKCHYTVDRWQVARTAHAEGIGAQPRVWPAVALGRTGSCLGCEREGGRRERLLVALRAADGEAWQCDLDEGRWHRLRDGDVRTIRVRVVTNSPVCSTLRP